MHDGGRWVLYTPPEKEPGCWHTTNTSREIHTNQPGKYAQMPVLSGVPPEGAIGTRRQEVALSQQNEFLDENLTANLVCDELRLSDELIQPGDVVLFSGAHLHGSVPNTVDDLTRDDISPRGEPEHFSGQPDVRTAALEPSDEHVLLTRFSVETRTIHERDWLSGMGAPSVDGTCADPPPVEWFRNVLEDTRGRKRLLEQARS